ncbi:auxin-induced protein X15 [Rhodamnia argentea]|uniref:Auxin-induced protein X15 n=1 Tax=Rhodamnia argentea TaxID=178133 RepID=A0A8B8QQ98_9MYRT|nr:auxin-induced protein X15 [Rhodamnia argentea]
MLAKKMVSFKKLAKKAKKMGDGTDREQSPHHEFLLGEFEEGTSSSPKTPDGFFAVYVGDEHQRFVVPTSFLSHPLFKILLEKASNEFGFEQRERLVVPCSVSTFQEVLRAIEGCNGRFDFGKLGEELI